MHEEEGGADACLIGALILLEVYNRRVWERLPLGPLLRRPIPYEDPAITQESASPESSGPSPR